MRRAGRREQAGQRGASGAPGHRQAPGRGRRSRRSPPAGDSGGDPASEVVAPATSTPKPSGAHAGEAGPVASTTATRPVTTASAAAATPGQAGTLASAVICSNSTTISATTPNGPMSDRRMIARASSRGRRLPSPSTVSADPVEVQPPGEQRGTPIASAAAQQQLRR